MFDPNAPESIEEQFVVSREDGLELLEDESRLLDWEAGSLAAPELDQIVAGTASVAAPRHWQSHRLSVDQPSTAVVRAAHRALILEQETRGQNVFLPGENVLADVIDGMIRDAEVADMLSGS
jgi:hypothetical protein